jgi:hypothetical protein
MYTPVEEEVDAIRDRIWEETKDMGPAEFNAYIERKTAPVIKKFGIKLVSPYPPSALLESRAMQQPKVQSMTEQKRKSMYTPVEEEVDAIRDRIWEEIKDMTPEERGAYYDRKTLPVMKEFGLKFASPTRTVRAADSSVL